MKKAEKNEEQFKYKSYNSEKTKIVFSSIMLVLAMFCELYLILNYNDRYEAIAILAFVIVTIMYVLVNSILNEKERVERKAEKQYEDLFKSEKASYLLVRKNYQEIEKKIIEIEKKLGAPKIENVEVQKNIAKLIIAKNIESTKELQKEIENSIINVDSKLNSLIISNEDYDTILQDAKDSLLTKVELLVNENNKEIASQLLLINKDFSIKQQQIVDKTDDLLQKEQDVINSINKLGSALNEINFKESEMQIVQEEIEPDNAIDLKVEESAIETPILMPTLETNGDPNKKLSADEIAALFASVN